MSKILSLVLILGFATAGIAHAGAFGPPSNFDSCGSLEPADDSMADPNGLYAFAGQPRCEKLCKKAKKVCTSILKDSLSCGKKIIASFKSFGHENCEVISKTPESRRECKSEVADLVEALDSGVQGARLTGIAGCESWEGACIETCDAPL